MKAAAVASAITKFIVRWERRLVPKMMNKVPSQSDHHFPFLLFIYRLSPQNESRTPACFSRWDRLLAVDWTIDIETQISSHLAFQLYYWQLTLLIDLATGHPSKTDYVACKQGLSSSWIDILLSYPFVRYILCSWKAFNNLPSMSVFRKVWIDLSLLFIR